MCFIIWTAFKYRNIYLKTWSSALKVKHHGSANLPDRADNAAIMNIFRNLERLFHLTMRASRDRFLDKHSHTGEMLKYLHLDVPSGLRGPSEHWGTANDDRTRLLTRGHVLDELIQRFEDAGVLVGGDNEGFTFLLQDCAGTVDCGVDQGYYFETRAELTAIKVRMEDGILGMRLTVRDGRSGSMDLHRILCFAGNVSVGLKTEDVIGLGRPHRT